MPVDLCFAALLADRRNELRPPPPHVTLEELRAGNRAFLTAAPAPPVHSVQNLAADGLAGSLTVRAYRPTAARRLPAVLFCHGGGFVLGDLDTHEYLCRQLALAAGAAVFAVDYRRAPETKFPAPVEDCHAALAWLAGNAQDLGVDAGRIALCGDSAGANLAAATTLLARSRGPEVRHLGMLYPITDAGCDTASMHEFGRGYMLTRAAMQWLWDQYLVDAASAGDPRASILRADLAGFPPTTVITAEFDPLRDEGEAFADRLAAAGVPVRMRRYPGMIHGFAGMPQLTPFAARAIADLADDLEAAYRAGCISS